MQGLNFHSVLMAPCYFLEKRTANFEVALAVVLWDDAVGIIMTVWRITIEILSIPQRTFTCFLKNGHKNAQGRCKFCSNLSNVLQQLTLVLLVNFINLEHLSRPTLVFLFKLWKDKCWLEVRRELCGKMIQRF